MLNSAEDQIQALERERLAAIGRGDAQAMELLLADDYVHVNSTGRVNDKAAFLKSMAGRARETTRGPLTIRIYGDTAVILGEQSNRTENADKSVTAISYVATQIARRTQNRWQLVLMQLTQKAAK
jgi:ketosteroid isomerase-like protein